MSRLLGFLFNRWTALALLLVLLLAVVWVVGPLVAIADWHPLDTPSSRLITGAVLLLLVALVIGWQRWRARRGNQQVVAQLVAAPQAGEPAESADMAAVRQRFEAAMATLQQARFGVAGPAGDPGAPASRSAWARFTRKLSGRYLYELPWYLIVGAPGSGKTTALRNAGLHFPLAAQMGEHAVRGVGGTRSCDWWFTDQAVLIDTAGRFTTQDSDQATDQATWGGFLALLKNSRPRQPLNGVLVTVSVADLMGRGAAEHQRYALAVRQRLAELHTQLGVRLPVYLLVTKCDLMAGFAESFAALDKAQRAEPWGFTFPLQPASAWQQQMGPELDALLQRLNDGQIDRLQAEPDAPRRARLYGFAHQLATLRGPLTEFVQQVFAGSPFEAEPLLRGVYLVSGTQEGTPIDRVLGAVARRYQLDAAMLPPQQASGRSYFLQRLLSEVVFAEQGLAGADQRWERRRLLLGVAGYATVAVLTVGLLAAWTLSWRNNRAYITAVDQRVQAVRALVQATPNRASTELLPILDALEATRTLAAAGDEAGAAPWQLGFGLYQGRKLDSAARSAYERMLQDALLPRLALRVEEQLRAVDRPEAQYEALKVYLMMAGAQPGSAPGSVVFDKAALKAHIEADWDVQQAATWRPEQRAALGRHLDALLALGRVASPLPVDPALIQATRSRLAETPLAQRVYNRLSQRGWGADFPEFTATQAGGPNAQLVFVRAKGMPLTRGVPGMFTYKGYHEGFQKVVGEATQQLADEQVWVLGIPAGQAKGAAALLGADRLVDDVRRLYLTDYRNTWKDFIADLRLAPLTSVAQSLEKTRFLAAPDSPLIPLMRAMSRETTLLAASGQGLVGQGNAVARDALKTAEGKLFGNLGVKPITTGAPTQRMESIVDDEFIGLRRLVTAPEGGKAPIEGVVARLAELQQLLVSVDMALKGGAAPPPSPLPAQLKVEAANAPEPVRSLLDTLGSSSAKVAQLQLRESLSREVRATVGEDCQRATAGRYPFEAGSPRDVTPADFAALFGPGGKFEQMQAKLAPYIDTSTRPWSFRPVDGTPLGADVGTLPQFQRAEAIRKAFFGAGAAPGKPGAQLTFKPVEMDPALRLFTMDVDGQTVRYDHGPTIPQPVTWPGPRGSNVVRVMVEPAGGTGLVRDGPWALFRLFEQVKLTSAGDAEKFRAVFDIDGRKVVFDIIAGSVRNPLQLPELRGFQCPGGL